MTLFESDTPEATPVGPAVTYHKGLFRRWWRLEELAAALPLKQRTANMYGKTVSVPRLECWFGERPYAFGGRVEEPQPWPPVLIDIRHAVQAAVGAPFDSCFANLYRDGKDTIPWHADDSAWIGEPIASVTFGAGRRFVMKRKHREGAVFSWTLGDGDLLVMHPGVQAEWVHSVPRTTATVGPRLNLTFRRTVGGA